MKRQYLARLDDGRDFTDFVFESEHHANSKANYADCKKELVRRHGKQSANSKRILSTMLWN